MVYAIIIDDALDYVAHDEEEKDAHVKWAKGEGFNVKVSSFETECDLWDYFDETQLIYQRGFARMKPLG